MIWVGLFGASFFLLNDYHGPPYPCFPLERDGVLLSISQCTSIRVPHSTVPKEVNVFAN